MTSSQLSHKERSILSSPIFRTELERIAAGLEAEQSSTTTMTTQKITRRRSSRRLSLLDLGSASPERICSFSAMLTSFLSSKKPQLRWAGNLSKLRLFGVSPRAKVLLLGDEKVLDKLTNSSSLLQRENANYSNPLLIFLTRSESERHVRRYGPEKPVGLIEQLIEAATMPGDYILDPCCGAGSTLAAARHLHRRALGIELEAAPYNLSVVVAERDEETETPPAQETPLEEMA